MAKLAEKLGIQMYQLMEFFSKVGEKFQTDSTTLMKSIFDTLLIPISTAASIQHQIIDEFSFRLGKAPQQVRKSLMEIVIHEAEMQADSIQAQADENNAEAEISNQSPEVPIIEVDGMANDDDWEDEDLRDRKGHIPRLYPRPPAVDGCGNKFITVVHSNGFHSLPIAW